MQDLPKPANNDEYIDELVTDNDHLRAENEALQRQVDALTRELQRMRFDREYLPCEIACEGTLFSQ